MEYLRLEPLEVPLSRLALGTLGFSPATRERDSCQSSGPAMWKTVRWPSSSRCRVAAAAPANWSTATIATSSSGPASTATTATSAGTCATALAALSCGAITRMPSTPWSRSRSTAVSTDARSSDRRLMMLVK